MSQRLPFLLSMHADNPTDAFVLFALAKEYEGLGDTANALRYYEAIRATDANYVGLYYHLGKLHELLGNNELAESVYADGMAVAKRLKDQHAWRELSSAKMNLGME